MPPVAVVGGTLVDPQKLSATLREAARIAREINLGRLEAAATPQVVAELLPQVQRALEDAVAALTGVLQHYDGTGTPSEVADLSFVARLELLSHQQQLGALGPKDDPLNVLSECGSSRRSVLRSTFAVDRALCAKEGLTFEAAELGNELQQSLRVRAGYSRFRRDLLALGEPELTGVAAYLERANDRVGRFIRDELFGDLRLDDRLHLHRLHARLKTWLDGEDGRDTKSGLRLWQDLAGFVSLLVQVNHRTELVEHDREVVRAAWDELFGNRPRTSVPEVLQKRLADLYGRDDGIDGMLDAGMGQFAIEWQEPLERLRAALGLP